MFKKNISEQKFGIFLILPSLLVLGLVAVYPIFRNLVLSFTKNGQFIGFDNFLLLFQDGRFKNSLFNTLLLTVISVPIQLCLGLLFAVILNKRFFGREFVRTTVFLPWALPTAIIAVTWKWMFNDVYGVFNDILLRFHMINEPLAWLGKPNLAFFCIILAEVWKCTPFVAVILLAGLQSIPTELHEAISVDGANAWQNFKLVTFPLLRPTLLVALIFRSIQALGIFDSIWILTGGGPGGSTESVSLYIYDTVFRYLKFNYGASLVMFNFIISLTFVFIVYALGRKKQFEY